MNSKISKFYENLFSDPVVKADLAQKMKEVKNLSELKKVIEEEIIPIAQKNGENFTVEDFVNFEKENINKISIEDLENISGGISLKPVILGGGLFALSILGVKVNTADAVIPTDVVTNYIVPGTEKNGPQPKGVQDANRNAQQNEQQTEENQGVQTPEQQIAKNQGIAQINESQQENEEIANTSAPIPMTDVVKANITGENAQQATTDEEYIMTALNPRDALAMNSSGTTENFRFCNGDTKTIAVGEPGGDGVPSLEFNKYSGEGSANLMTSLCPSSAGEMSTEGGCNENHPFSKDCAPTPELMAETVACLHNHVRTADENSKINFDELQSISFPNFNYADYEYISENLESIKEQNDSAKKWEEMLSDAKVNEKDLNEKIKKLGFKEIKNKNEFNEIYNNFSQKYNKLKNLDFDLSLIKDENSLKTVLFLLRNAQYMIENQEQDGTDKTKDRILPQYTAERMLMCYFLNHFNNAEDLDRFYNAAKKYIHGDTKVSEETKERDKMMKAVLSKIHSATNCPYKNKLAQDGPTKTIEKDGESLKFTSRTFFEDCADITVRHFFNLMGYNDANKWDYFLADANVETLENNKNQILNAINNNAQLPNLSLKDKLQAFIYYQSKKGADNTSIETRSFWNAVVSHMDNPPAGSGGYPIRYDRNDGNKVGTGFVNMLKVTYNLLHALGKDCGAAKTAIDAMITIPNGRHLTAAMREILKIFNPNAKVLKLENIKYENNEIYGYLTVNSDGKEFTIYHSGIGAWVEFNPLKIGWLEEAEKKFVKSDPTAQLLAGLFNIDLYGSTIPKFNKYYGGRGKLDSEERESQQYANFSALRFLKTIQGEGNNVHRIFDEMSSIFKNSNVKVFHGKSLMTLPVFICVNYTQKNLDTFKKFLHPFLGPFWCPFAHNLNTKKSPLYEFAKKNNILGTHSEEEYMCIEKENGVEIFPFWDYYTTGCPENFVIPAKVILNGQEKKVCGIAPFAFYENSNVKNVSFEKGFAAETFTIGQYAFFKCENLTSFTSPDSVTTFTIGAYAFWWCKNLTSFTSPDSVTTFTIGEEAFLCCKNLTSFTSPDSVTTFTIGKEAFWGCENLTSFTSLASVTTFAIGEGAFWNCRNLTSFTSLASVTTFTIGKEAFGVCKSLENVTLFASVTTLTIEESAFKYSAITSLTIPDSVITLAIDTRAIYDAENLKYIIVPIKFKEQIESLDNNTSAEIRYVNEEGKHVDKDGKLIEDEDEPR